MGGLPDLLLVPRPMAPTALIDVGAGAIQTRQRHVQQFPAAGHRGGPRAGAGAGA